MSNKQRLKQLHKTIDTIVKVRKIQKARVDSNVMGEELTQEELERFHRPMVDQLASIVDTTKSQQATLLPIEGLSASPIQSIEGPSTTLIPIGSEHESTTLTPIDSEHTSKEPSKSPKRVRHESFKIFFILIKILMKTLLKRFTD
jgi:hypothetical protein